MKLFAWGANSHGQLGLGVNTEQCIMPQEVDVLDGFFDPANVDVIVGGGGHSLILTKDNLVYGCGWNASGQLACEHYNDLNTFTLISLLVYHKPKALACGWDWSAGITDWGELMTWGSNTHCQLGFPKSRKERLAVPGFISPTLPLTQIACGMRHMAAVTEHGQVLVWGSSRRMALGITDNFDRPAESISFPTEVPDLKDVAKIACGQHHTVALTNKGSVYVWGDNKHGQLGLDPDQYPSVHTPTELEMSGHPHISGKSQLVAGWTHSAIVTDDGRVINWGRNCYGQLGRYEHKRCASWQPQVVENIGLVKKLCVGSEHNVAQLDSGRLTSWGWNEHGNCGTGTEEDVRQPVPVVADLLKKVVCLGTGNGHSFAVADS